MINAGQLDEMLTLVHRWRSRRRVVPWKPEDIIASMRWKALFVNPPKADAVLVKAIADIIRDAERGELI